jgi:hypothetical protein
MGKHLFVLPAILLLSACASVQLPQPDEWTDHGIIVAAGKKGDWDERIYPGISSPSTAVVSGREILLYYIAAAGDRTSDGGPARRSVGLLSGSGARSYSKYAQNPVISFFPNPEGCNGEEEGIWRATAALHGGPETIIYFGGLTQTSCRGSVQSDILSVSSADGRIFSEPSTVLAATDKSIWGSGKKGAEIFPAAAYEHDGEWYLFYVSKEVRPAWSLGLALGPTPDRFSMTRSLLMADHTSLGAGTRIRSASVWPIQTNAYVLFLKLSNSSRQMTRLEARIFDPREPTVLGDPVTVFDWEGEGAASVSGMVALDDRSGDWSLYYVRDKGGIRLMTAPIRK